MKKIIAVILVAAAMTAILFQAFSISSQDRVGAAGQSGYYTRQQIG